MMFVRVKDAPSFEGDTLIVPIVSTGNVGQLAVDLFLSTGWAAPSNSPISLKRVGYLETEHVSPAVGYEVFYKGQSPQICLNLELHRFSGRPVTLLQQRAPVIPGSEAAFAAELMAWACRSGFKEVLLVSGADPPGGLDPTPGGIAAVKQYRAYPTTSSQAGAEEVRPPRSKLEDALRSAGVGELDLKSAANVTSIEANRLLDMPGGAMARETFEMEEPEDGERWWGRHREEGMPHFPSGMGVCGHMCKQAGTDAPPTTILLHFCSEGDNVPQAVTIAEVINTALGLFPVENGEGIGAGEDSSGEEIFYYGTTGSKRSHLRG